MMYATIRQYRLDPAQYRQLIPRLEAEFIPLLEQIDGFRNYRVWIDETGHIVSATTFDDRAGCERSDALAAEMHQELTGGMVIELLSASIGEVVVTHPPLPPRD
jgi:hypothetical protein